MAKSATAPNTLSDLGALEARIAKLNNRLLRTREKYLAETQVKLKRSKVQYQKTRTALADARKHLKHIDKLYRQKPGTGLQRRSVAAVNRINLAEEKLELASANLRRCQLEAECAREQLKDANHQRKAILKAGQKPKAAAKKPGRSKPAARPTVRPTIKGSSVESKFGEARKTALPELAQNIRPRPGHKTRTGLRGTAGATRRHK